MKTIYGEAWEIILFAFSIFPIITAIMVMRIYHAKKTGRNDSRISDLLLIIAQGLLIIFYGGYMADLGNYPQGDLFETLVTVAMILSAINGFLYLISLDLSKKNE